MVVFEVAPLDSYASRITSGVAYIGGILMLPVLFAYLSGIRWNGLLIPSAMAALFALMLILTYASQPTEYKIDETHLIVVRRWLRPIRVPLIQVSGVSLASTLAGVPHQGLRFAFNPGVFGYQGPFWLDPYGSVFFIATNREKLISIARRGTIPLIVSPARPLDFQQALQSRAGKYAENTYLGDRGDHNDRPDVPLPPPAKQLQPQKEKRPTASCAAPEE